MLDCDDGIVNVVVVVLGNVGKGDDGVLEEGVVKEGVDEGADTVIAWAVGFALGIGRIG